MFVGIIIFMLSFVVHEFFAKTYDIYGVIILTFGEMFVWPAVPTIANQLAPEITTVPGFVNSAATVGKALVHFLVVY